MKKITLNSKYRLFTKIIIWTISVGSIIIAFFSLPIFAAVLIAVICVVIPLIIDKIVFRYNILWIHPDLSDILLRRIGFSWFYEKNNGKMTPGFSILYERKYDAKYAYNILKSWNYGKYIDTQGNISVNFIDESENKFSVFLYPGERKQREEEIKATLKEKFPANSELNLKNRMFISIQNCGDYSDRPEMIEAFKLIRKTGKVLINTCYVVDNKIKSYAKRKFVIEKIRFVDRAALTEKDLEYKQVWENPIQKYPENAERVSKISINAG